MVFVLSSDGQPLEGQVQYKTQDITPVFWFLASRVLTVGTPMGRSMRTRFSKAGIPLGRVRPKDFADAGIERVARTTGVLDGLPVLEDGRVMDVANVVWCTGFQSDYS